jgi:hypothetical protein
MPPTLAGVQTEFKFNDDGKFRTVQPSKARDGLLHPIACRVRQRALMVLKPNPIAHVDVAVTERTFEKVFGLVERRTADLLADHGPAWSRIIDARDFQLITSQKNQAPDCSEA